VSEAAVNETIERIKSIVGLKGFVSDPAEVEPYLVEGRGLYRGETMLVVRPANTEEVAEIVKLCAAAKLPIVPQSGNTGLSGGGVPLNGGRNIVLSTARMNRVRAVDANNFTMTVEAGVILADVQKAAEEADRLFPLSLGAEGSCRIGGNLSTNAGGVGTLRYGNARDLVLGLEVVLADGRIWSGLRTLRKDNTGYDLKHLFVGAEGTLGIITAASLKLFPRPREVETAFLAIDRIDDLMEVFARARGATADQLTAFELIPRIGLEIAMRHTPDLADPIAEPHPYYALLEVSSSQQDSGLRDMLESLLGELMEAGLVRDGVIASSKAQALELWKIREGTAIGQLYEGGSIKHDVSVPVSRVAEFIKTANAAVTARLPGIRIVSFGHVGDGNIHYNLSQPVGDDKATYLKRWQEFNTIVHDIVVAMGGSISAEHGIGLVRMGELAHYKPALDLELMRRIKQTLDPDGIMNPGKVIG
jgi:FAD/FMN-containing dehydrogenase